MPIRSPHSSTIIDTGRQPVSSTQDAVRERYRAKALQMADAGCCGDACCGGASAEDGCGSDYTAAELAEVGLSNCVINLAEDKGEVIREAFRVLRPGGRFAVSDMVALRDLPAPVKQALDAWAGCVAGTIPVQHYRQLMVDAGFEGVDFEI